MPKLIIVCDAVMVFKRQAMALRLIKRCISYGIQRNLLQPAYNKVFVRTFKTSSRLTKQFHIEEPTTPRPKFQLREYQQRCIDQCVDALENDRRRIGVSLPTGGGKTVVFSNLIDQVKPKNGHGDKVMILAHRKELIFQAAATCKSVHPEKVVDVEMANYHATEDADIVIASVQTLMRGRLEKFNPLDFKMIIVDEAHHAAADSYVSTFNYFGITEPDSDVALVGFSATLQRDDDKHLADVIDEVVFHMDTEQMVTDKHLCDAKFTTVKLVNADLSGVTTRGGEFVIPKLAAAVNNPENNELVLRTYFYFVNTQNVRSALLFGVDIKHVRSLAALFKERGVDADFVTSETKAPVRKERIDKFKKGKLSVLMNCGIFTEGTDIPNIDCVLLVRPTRSKTLLIQMIGRGLRLHHSKEFCHIVDFVGVNNANVISVPCLRGLPNDDQINDLTLEEMEERKALLEEKRAKKEEQDRLEALKKKQEEAELLDADLREGTLSTAPVAEYDEEAFDFQNIELKTFESFHDFIEMGEMPKEDDIYYIKSSIYPWVRIDNNTWIVNYPSIKKGIQIHLRLQRFKKGITKKFLKDVSVREIYKNKKAVEEHMNTKHTMYTLSSYTTNPQYDRGVNFFAKKYKALLLLPLSRDIRSVLSYVDKIFKERFRGRDLTKFAAWRKAPSSEKQQKYVFNIVNRYMQERLAPDSRLSIINEIPNLKSGEVSDFLAAYTIVGTNDSLEHFVDLLHKRAIKENKLEPQREYTNLKPFFEMMRKGADLEELKRLDLANSNTSQSDMMNQNKPTPQFHEP